MKVKDKMSSVRNEQATVAVESWARKRSALNIDSSNAYAIQLTFLLQRVELGEEGGDVNDNARTDETCAARIDKAYPQASEGNRAKS